MSKRTHTGRGVSLPDDAWRKVDTRVEQLRPWVNGLSSYVQRLVYLDLAHGLLREDGTPNTAVFKTTGKVKKPFNQPTVLLAA